ncbi:GNAT family N-acetyltransferase [Micromonospora mirobrigensis]|uniref:NAD(P)H-dependent FMN reductase n=1 Tax=Micromonospora mirobrigensis TaxID=262898 RepID=A0A1C4U7P6_9ACTN|nr:GNAT family N-acetyltransferase [Micromonospora mirobrigensis]SCE67676.1 NAD(P)H-dependent FMN reductase [Micromonospora mirobrigensis]
MISKSVPRLVAGRLVLEPLDGPAASAVRAGDLAGLTVADGWPHDDTLDGLGGIADGHSFGWLVTLDGVVIGDCGVHGPADEHGDIEIGYGLAAPHRGHGHGAEVVAALTRHLLSRPEVRRVVAGTEAGNRPSRRVLERAGFRHTGTDGDELRYAADTPPPTILLISGSTRAASTNSAALRTVAAVAPDGVHTQLYDELAALPAFNPDDDRESVQLPPAVARLRARLDAADGVLLCTPEYAGTLPGSLKNLLDWTVGGGQLDGRPVASLNVAAPGRGDGAQATLRLVLGYVAAELSEAASVRLVVPRDAVGDDGLVVRPDVRDELRRVLTVFADELRERQPA